MTQRYLYFPYSSIEQRYQPPRIVSKLPREFHREGVNGPVGEEYLTVSVNYAFIYNIVDPEITHDTQGLHQLTHIPGPGLLYMTDDDGKIVPIAENILQRLPNIVRSYTSQRRFYGY